MKKMVESYPSFIVRATRGGGSEAHFLTTLGRKKTGQIRSGHARSATQPLDHRIPVLLALITRIGGLLPDSVRRWTMQPFRFTVGKRVVSN
jgi:hypothetical protein